MLALAASLATADGMSATLESSSFRGFFSGCGKHAKSCMGCLDAKGTFNRKQCRFVYVSDGGESVLSKCVSSLSSKVKKQLRHAASEGHYEIVEAESKQDCPATSFDTWGFEDLNDIRAHLVANDPTFRSLHDYDGGQIGKDFHSHAEFCQAVRRNDVDTYAEETTRTSGGS